MTRKMLVSVSVSVAATVSATVACGGSGGGRAGGGPTGPGAAVLSVGGDYAMAVALAENGCGAVTVLPLPTRVDHAPGATTFQLTHGPATYAGTVQPGGAFATEPRAFADATGTQTVTIAGRFLVSGLEATATVDMQPGPGGTACRYTVAWTGTKAGVPNTIP